MSNDPRVQEILNDLSFLDSARQAAILAGLAEMMAKRIADQDRQIAILYTDLDRAGLTARGDE